MKTPLKPGTQSGILTGSSCKSKHCALQRPRSALKAQLNNELKAENYQLSHFQLLLLLQNMLKLNHSHKYYFERWETGNHTPTSSTLSSAPLINTHKINQVSCSIRMKNSNHFSIADIFFLYMSITDSSYYISFPKFLTVQVSTPMLKNCLSELKQ